MMGIMKIAQIKEKKLINEDAIKYKVEVEKAQYRKPNEITVVLDFELLKPSAILGLN